MSTRMGKRRTGVATTILIAIFCGKLQWGRLSVLEVVDGGLICSCSVHVEEMGDKNSDGYIVDAAIYAGY
ncbi:unnamed protein product [Linum trigynum]|uniref:Uncharacterized protein n=1 Tax=Linum trigynum TaxID=586398 RepID=A0AAV2DZA4_9ROSI